MTVQTLITRSFQPLAVRLSSARPSVDIGDVAQRSERPRLRNRRWCADVVTSYGSDPICHRFGKTEHLVEGHLTSLANEADVAEITVLVSLPALPSVPQPPSVETRGTTSTDNGDQRAPSALSEQAWSQYSVGVAQVSYHGDGRI